MRNKVKLWIENRYADLDDGSFLLLNYTAEDLSNPTIVKNSFSRQITLKGTPNNDAIFGYIFRNDRNTLYGSPYTGPYFDPTRKTSFIIFNEANEILESGYLKLDEIVTTRKKHEYKVTLFGGLGSFLYGLSYKANGDKMTLADLDFGDSLGFTINRSTVEEAWARLGGDSDADLKYDIINFMPGYFGLPPSPFDTNKCVVRAETAGLPTRDGYYYAGYTVVTLNDKVTGEEAKDYRSYLQKPVIKMQKVISAICNSANNGGYTVNLDAAFFKNDNPYWVDAWLTLPMLNDLNIDEATVTNQQTINNTGAYSIVGGITGNVGVTVNLNLACDMIGLPNYDYKMWCRDTLGNVINYLVVTLDLFDSSNNIISTAVYRITTSGLTVSSMYPQPDFTFHHIDGGGFFVDLNGNPVTFPLYIEGRDAVKFQIEVLSETYYWGSAGFNPGSVSDKMWKMGESDASNNFWFRYGVDTSTVDVVGESSTTVRTGTNITKAMLLSGSKTPADYLLSYCKMFGLQLVPQKDSKTVDIVLRKTLYNGGTVNINGRIDRSREITKRPFSFDARWYLFGNAAVGEYADYYRKNYGREYGQFRVNTGYEFDAEQKVMTEGIVFNNAVSVMEASAYFCDLVMNGKNIPSVFLSGGKFLMYMGSESKSFDLPSVVSAAKTWMNASYPMHDYIDRVQFHGQENAHINERDTLVFFRGMRDTSSEHLSLTDDFDDMLYLNGNTPCWLPNICDYDASWKLSALPLFSRCIWSGGAATYQFDWGDPLEMQIPGGSVTANSNIYDQYWKKYIADRYDDDSAVVTAYVDLRGYKVDETLLRKFYWFDGALWALNRIIDHALTTDGPTKCEFVKVQDSTNYTSL
jgi:hypothetical protein